MPDYSKAPTNLLSQNPDQLSSDPMASGSRADYWNQKYWQFYNALSDTAKKYIDQNIDVVHTKYDAFSNNAWKDSQDIYNQALQLATTYRENQGSNDTQTINAVDNARAGRDPSTSSQQSQQSASSGAPTWESLAPGSGQEAQTTGPTDPARTINTDPTQQQQIQTYGQATAGQWNAYPNDINYLASQVGQDPQTLQSEYQSYLQSYQSSSQRWLQGNAQSDSMRARPGGPGPTTNQGQVNPATSTPLTLQQYAQVKAQAVNGVWQPVIDLYSQQYESQFNKPMPLELHNQLLTQLNSLSPQNQVSAMQALATYKTDLDKYNTAVSNYQKNQQNPAYLTSMQQQLQAAQAALVGSASTATTPSTTSTSATSTGALPPIIRQTFNNYLALHPDATQTQATQESNNEQQFINSYYTLWGTMPSADLIQQARTKSGDDLSFSNPSSWINSLSFKMGMTAGQYQDAKKRVDGFRLSGAGRSVFGSWQQIFGHTPTDQEIYQASSMNDAQLQDWANASPSKLKGINVGQYANYKTTMDDMSSKAFGTPASDELIKAFHATN